MNKVVFAVSLVTMAVSSALAAEEVGIIEVEGTRLVDVNGEELQNCSMHANVFESCLNQGACMLVLMPQCFS